LVAPDWKITVMDEAHKPVKGALVRESYTNYSIENEGHETDAFADGFGRVSFPTRKIHASLLTRILGTLRAATGGAHASFGPSAYVNAFGTEGEGSWEKDGYIGFWHGSPAHLESTIVLHPIKSAY
jgi:hypothetical protein